jgi:hypothetical protein
VHRAGPWVAGHGDHADRVRQPARRALRQEEARRLLQAKHVRCGGADDVDDAGPGHPQRHDVVGEQSHGGHPRSAACRRCRRPRAPRSPDR